jgi:hypothetical protein
VRDGVEDIWLAGPRAEGVEEEVVVRVDTDTEGAVPIY